MPTKRTTTKKATTARPRTRRKKVAEPTVAPVVQAVESAPRVVESTPTHRAGTFLYAIGRRKSAIAQIRLVKEGTGKVTINERTEESYFTRPDLRAVYREPMSMVGVDKTMDIEARVHGGGITGQAESVRHAVARALISLNPDFKTALKKAGFLTRDARMKERKKPGLKAARRAPQWAKR